ncbi:MAG: peptide ABC transporter ATP-binding protein [Thermoplasmata archaeon M9B2D]|nr:MAG: peptide ABC transporter ATP-binding protein [Thermoplasmata archaeon M8B2D]PNX50061.1 MAG: peptide ABC transporter ATP-binding protein [Thermoplasmata archaeon M9B2D]
MKGETFGLIGETGCGKSVTALSVMRLIPEPPGKIMKGSILFKGKDLLKKTEKEMRKVRGNEISMIFQEPMTALNPVYTVGYQIAEVILLHESFPEVDQKIPWYNLWKKRNVKKSIQKKAFEKAINALDLVKISDPKKVVKQYPHELSGGMRQRVMIAMMLACNPDLLIADEPTTALDVTVQAQILDLMKDLQKRIGSAVWIITHNLGIIAEMCDHVGVMYAGYIVEIGTTEKIFDNPDHPYTRGLIRAIPKITEEQKRLDIIPGTVPNLIEPPSGCRFHPRCRYCTDICKKQIPLLREVEKDHSVACHHYGYVKYSKAAKEENERNHLKRD